MLGLISKLIPQSGNQTKMAQVHVLIWLFTFWCLRAFHFHLLLFQVEEFAAVNAFIQPLMFDIVPVMPLSMAATSSASKSSKKDERDGENAKENVKEVNGFVQFKRQMILRLKVTVCLAN